MLTNAFPAEPYRIIGTFPTFKFSIVLNITGCPTLLCADDIGVISSQFITVPAGINAFPGPTSEMGFHVGTEGSAAAHVPKMPIQSMAIINSTNTFLFIKTPSSNLFSFRKGYSLNNYHGTINYIKPNHSTKGESR
jgi:hypothetical protein